MTKDLTLREKILDTMESEFDASFRKMTAEVKIHAIADILEDTGSPAHMIVAAELRGE